MDYTLLIRTRRHAEMKTVKEISQITGISVRALHYYDEIGLLKPTAKTGAGYRLYDDKALETLRQILFFREFDIPLKEIRSLLDTPDLDKRQILKMQKQMLTAKRDRIDRMIASINKILKGEHEMDFTVFTKTEIEAMYQSMIEHMTEDQKAVFIENHGSMEEFHKYFVESASSEAAQKNFRKVVDWYGSKEQALAASQRPHDPDIFSAYQNRLSAVLEKLAGKTDCDVHSFDVKELIREYDFVTKQLYQMDDVSRMMLESAEMYLTDPRMKESTDRIYGKGFSEFFGQAVKAFYTGSGEI